MDGQKVISEKKKAYDARRSAISKEIWNRPGHREKMSVIQKQVFNTPEYKANRAKAMQKVWEDPEYRKHMSKMQSTRMRTDECRKNMSLATKAYWLTISAEERRMRSQCMTDAHERRYETVMRNWDDDDWRNSRWAKMREKGTDEKAAKLSDDDVREVRYMLDGGWQIKEIANTFNVSGTIISYIKSGKTYKHVKDE